MPTWLKYLICLVVTLAIASSGLFFPPGPWYRELVRPPLTPADAIFGPVWTILYVLMALAAGNVWQSSPPGTAAGPLALYGVQLVLNALWSPLFFGLHLAAAALADLALLWLAALTTAIVFCRRTKLAGLLLVPYLAWLSFAAYLNAGFVWLNW